MPISTKNQVRKWTRELASLHATCDALADLTKYDVLYNHDGEYRHRAAMLLIYDRIEDLEAMIEQAGVGHE